MNRARVSRVGGRVVWNGLLILLITFLLAPTAITALLSFSDTAFIKFPPERWGTRQYSTLFSSSEWLEPLIRSLILAAVVSVIAIAVGGAAVIAIHRLRAPGGTFLQFAALGPIVAPIVAYAVALYSMFAALRMIGTAPALALSHAMLAIPLVVFILGAALVRIPRDLELAATSLGASRARAWRDVTFPLLMPAIVASVVFAFMTSFDEPAIASFLSGTDFVTLPVTIFSSVRTGVDPVITAIATLLTIGTAILLGTTAAVRRRGP